jgi:hypothetical protein
MCGPNVEKFGDPWYKTPSLRSPCVMSLPIHETACAVTKNLPPLAAVDRASLNCFTLFRVFAHLPVCKYDYATQRHQSLSGQCKAGRRLICFNSDPAWTQCKKGTSGHFLALAPIPKPNVSRGWTPGGSAENPVSYRDTLNACGCSELIWWRH